MKPLKDLNLMDRFLFAEAMENPIVNQAILSVIMGEEILLQDKAETEKEFRISPLLRSIRLDVYAMDYKNRIFDTEVQNRNTKNLPRRSRFYQALEDCSLLEPGSIDFNLLNDSFIIMITSFDLFGENRYRYTFRMACDEVPGLELLDGQVRIFLNTRGTNDDEVSLELAELLHYMEDTSDLKANQSKSPVIRTIHEQIQKIKSSEEIGVKYMQAWEEKVYERIEAKAEGLAEGKAEGLAEGKANEIRIIRKKFIKGLSAEEIADLLETDEIYVSQITELLENHPEESNTQIAARYFAQQPAE